MLSLGNSGFCLLVLLFLSHFIVFRALFWLCSRIILAVLGGQYTVYRLNSGLLLKRQVLNTILYLQPVSRGIHFEKHAKEMSFLFSYMR